jgi:murein DD-endopeptidase MepM/ murein hydrolase activator NlpD
MPLSLIALAGRLVRESLYALAYDNGVCSAMETALTAHAAGLPHPHDAKLIYCKPSVEPWAYGLGVLVDPESGTKVPSEPILVLAYEDDARTWQVFIPSGDRGQLYSEWLDRLPNAPGAGRLLDYLHLPLSKLDGYADSQQTASSSYRLPYADGWKGTVTGVPYVGTHANTPPGPYYAVDFNIWGDDWSSNEYANGYVAAARDGTVVYVKESSTHQGTNNTDKSWWKANMVVLGHGACSGGSFSEYSWYVHLAHNSVPEHVYPGRTIKAGEIVGQEGDSGYAEGVHLHFMVSDYFPTTGDHFGPVTLSNCVVPTPAGEDEQEEAPWPPISHILSFSFEEGCYVDSLTSPRTVCSSENEIARDNAVVLYWDADYHGPAVRYAQDNVNGRCMFDSNSGKSLCNIPAFLNDRISSIQVNEEGRIFGGIIRSCGLPV